LVFCAGHEHNFARRRCAGKYQRFYDINYTGDRLLPIPLFFFLPAEMDSGHKGRQGNQARQGHYQHNIATSPVHYLEQQRQTQQTYGGGS
jgi:hypothetical protein